MITPRPDDRDDLRPVYVAGLTDAAGPDVRDHGARSGSAPDGLQPAAWTTWKAMTFNTQAGNNYEYQAPSSPARPGLRLARTGSRPTAAATWATATSGRRYPGGSGTTSRAS